MPVTQQTHWKTTGTEPTAGVDDEYVVNEQPIAEHDNWFNYYLVDDITNALVALQDTTLGHDHDGANSKTVDASNVVNTPAGGIIATDTQGAIDELDTDKTNSATNSYAGNSTVNRAIPHGLGRTPNFVYIVRQGLTGAFTIFGTDIHSENGSAANVASVTAMDATNFYVGNAATYEDSANITGKSYDWVALT